MAKAEAKEENNESMESILSKIKNIVSGKEKVSLEDEGKAEAVAAEEEPMELTEMVEVEMAPQPAAEEVAQPEPAPAAQPDITQNLTATEMAATADQPEEEMVDILKEIDQALEKQYSDTQAGNANVAQEQPQNAAPQVQEVKKEFAEPISQNIIEPQGVSMAEETKENILSQDIAAKSSKAIQSLLNSVPRPQIDSPAFRSANTLEDLAMEMIKPLLKEWLDKNLEVIVREIVEREIKKIMPRE